MRTIVYVDGFNLYYAIRYTQHRWLNPLALCQTLLPNDQILELKYFTAPIKSQPDDPNAKDRQAVYLRALSSLAPTVSVHVGRFLRNKNRMPLTWRPKNRFERWALSRALKDPKKSDKSRWDLSHDQGLANEEKGSDVNLASHLLIDGFNGGHDLAVVVVERGDLEFPVDYVRTNLRIPVAILDAHPHRNKKLAPDVMPPGSFDKRIRGGPLGASQFPLQMADAKGSFSRPAGWGQPKPHL